MTNYVSFYFVNNIAVTLLERQQYQDAMNTFQDAIHVYHYICSQEPRHHQTSGKESSSSTKLLLSKMFIDNDMILEEIINRASNRLSCSNRKPLYAKDSELDPMIALDVADDDYFTSLLKFGLSIDQIDFVIRMNDNNMSSSEYNKDWKLDFAMLIFNFGVACKRSSEVSPDKYDFSEECQSILREKSIQLFYMAHCIVIDGLKTYTSAIQIKSIYNNQDNVWCALHALIISIFTAAHIRDMMYWGHSTEEGMKYNIKFQNSFRLYITLVQEYMKRYGSSSTKHAAVA